MTNATTTSATLLLLAVSICQVATAENSVANTPAANGEGVDANYVIGPGDVLQLFVFNHPELTLAVPVRPDGKVSTQLIEDMTATGKTPSALGREMEQKLARYLREPQVNVVVTQPAGVNSQVKVIGSVMEPKGLPYHEGMKVLDAVLAAGGAAKYAALNRSKLLRTENGKRREIRVKLGKLLKDGDLTQNIALRPGDVLLIPESRF